MQSRGSGGLKAAIKPTVTGSRKIYSFVKGTRKVVCHFADDVITVTKYIDGKIDETVDVIENIKFKNKSGDVVEGSLEIVTQGDEVGALIIKQSGLFEPDYLIRVANNPDKIMPFVEANIDEFTTLANIDQLWSLGSVIRGRLIESVLAVKKYRPQGYNFVGGWNYKYIDFVDDVEEEIVEEIASIAENVVSLKTFNTSKVGAEALAAFKQSLQRSAKALNDATLPAVYSKSNKILDIVVMKGKFDLKDLDQIWNEVRSKYPNVKEVRFDEF